MTYWHEPSREMHGWIFLPQPGSRVGVVFRGRDVRKEPFQGYFMRYEGRYVPPKGLFHYWLRTPEDWFELWPHEPLMAFSREEAIFKFEPILSDIENGSIDSLFDIRTYIPRVKPKLIEEIEHAAYHAKAQIFQSPNGLYNIMYRLKSQNHSDNSSISASVKSDEFIEWDLKYEKDENGLALDTMADNLASAEEIALIELYRHVENSPKIRRRMRTNCVDPLTIKALRTK